MDMHVSDPLAPLSLSRLDDDATGFAEALCGSFRKTGFAVIKDHGVDPQVIERAYGVARRYFALPTKAKLRHHAPGGGGARGYTPFGTEAAKGEALVDLKEFWHRGRDLPEDHRYAGRMTPNVPVPEVEDFDAATEALFTALDGAGRRVLRGVAIWLGLAPDWFESRVAEGNSVLRLLHYPPVPDGAEGVRAAAHEDINVITLLLGAEEAGLQLLTREGRWLDVSPPEGALVINVGDMLQRLTNHVLPSTTHRVINPADARRDVPRYSMPYFLHFQPDVDLGPLPSCITPDNPSRYADALTADGYLQQRLREIGLT